MMCITQFEKPALPVRVEESVREIVPIVLRNFEWLIAYALIQFLPVQSKEEHMSAKRNSLTLRFWFNALNYLKKHKWKPKGPLGNFRILFTTCCRWQNSLTFVSLESPSIYIQFTFKCNDSLSHKYITNNFYIQLSLQTFLHQIAAQPQVKRIFKISCYSDDVIVNRLMERVSEFKNVFFFYFSQGPVPAIIIFYCVPYTDFQLRFET